MAKNCIKFRIYSLSKIRTSFLSLISRALMERSGLVRHYLNTVLRYDCVTALHLDIGDLIAHRDALHQDNWVSATTTTKATNSPRFHCGELHSFHPVKIKQYNIKKLRLLFCYCDSEMSDVDTASVFHLIYFSFQRYVESRNTNLVEMRLSYSLISSTYDESRSLIPENALEM